MMNIKSTLVLFIAACFLSGAAMAKNDKNKDKHKHKSLPPGLEKNYRQGKPLPPGWQKKLSRGDILSNDIYLRGKVVVPLGKDGSMSILVEGSLITLMKKTREIISIAH